MGIKPLVVAARYKYILLIPFVVILPIALFLSWRNVSTEYTSTARLFARESVIADNFTSGNPYASPAENRSSDMNELLQTEKYKLAVAEIAGLPTANREQQETSMWAIEFGTQVYASGRHLMVVSHTSSNAERAQKIVESLVETFRDQYRDQVLANAGNALKVYQANLEANRQVLDEAQAALNEYVGSRPTSESLATDPRFLSLQRALDRAEQDYENTQQTIIEIETQRENSIAGQDFTLSEQDPAMVPANANPFSKREFIALPIGGLLIALSLAAALYAFLLKTDSRLRTRDDIEQVTSIPVLATVPDVSAEKRKHWPKDFARVAVGSRTVNEQA